MEPPKKNLKNTSIPCLIDLPEQVLRQIFHYIDFETLFVHLQETCQSMKNVVNQYINMGGVFLMVGRVDSPLELLFVFRQASKRFNVYRKGIAPISCDVSNEHPGSLCGPLCPPFYDELDDEPSYFAWNNTIVSCLKQRQRYVIYQYQFETGKWKIIYKNVSVCEAKSHVPPSLHCHPFKLPEGTWYPLTCQKNKLNATAPYLDIKHTNYTRKICGAKFCGSDLNVQGLTEINSLLNYSSVCIDSKRICIVGGVWQSKKEGELFFRTNFRTKIAKGHSSSLNAKIILKTNEVASKDIKQQFNRLIMMGEISSSGLSITWKSKYISDIPYRSFPLCFKLKNNLYIAGSYAGNIDRKAHIDEVCNHERALVDCFCCDRFDFTIQKYYRNVYSIPYTINRVNQPKVTKNAAETFAVIAFYDLLDCQDKIWIFTEDAGFEDHSDFATSSRCKMCAESRPANTFKTYLQLRQHRQHQLHSSWKRQILSIK